MTREARVTIGAVAYDPKVVTIWEGIRDRVEVMWTSPPFDHCMFDALASLPEPTAEVFQRALLAMSWDDPRHRKLLELEGLKQWVAPRESGYESLCAALTEQGAW